MTLPDHLNPGATDDPFIALLRLGILLGLILLSAGAIAMVGLLVSILRNK